MKWRLKYLDWFISWLYTYRLYGPRCKCYCDGCVNCESWKFHDELFNPERIDVYREEEYETQDES